MPDCVIVTGAAGGIGQAVARSFLAKGAQVTCADIRLEAVREFVDRSTDGLDPEAGGRAHTVGVDVTDTPSLRAMVEFALTRMGRVDVLVHCAGLDAPRADITELDDALWDRIIALDLSSAFRSAKAVLPHMMQRQQGRIILIGSIAGWRPNRATAVAYNAAKAGVHGLTAGLAKQLEPHGILVNAVAPGPTGTGEPMNAEEIAADRALFPLPIAGPQPVAEACLYLAGPGGRWISGTVLTVAGGRWYR